jgi:hypothetical protein
MRSGSLQLIVEQVENPLRRLGLINATLERQHLDRRLATRLADEDTVLVCVLPAELP